jgi:hypothetical protein
MSFNYASLLPILIEYITKWLEKHRALKNLVLPLLESAAHDVNLPDNTARREWVVNWLITEKQMKESDARLLVEAGLKLYKKIAKKKADAQAKKDAAAAKKAAKKG